MSLESSIQQWVTIDDQIKSLNEKLSLLREQKKKTMMNITNYNKQHDIINNPIKLKNNILKVVNVKNQEPLTFKYLEKSLSDIIENKDNVEQIINHLKENRQYKYSTEIKRYNR